jgi:hypothetical protein
MLSRRTAIPVCAIAGLLLGALLSAAGGYFFGTGMIEEYLIYGFVGVVLGTVLGGVIGAVLASRLKDSDSRGATSDSGDVTSGSTDTSGQLIGGVMRIVVGLVIIAAGGLFFTILGTMERGGGGPRRMPRIVIAAYELMGKWGVLGVLGAIGLAMIFGGVRSMFARSVVSRSSPEGR